jgi:DNA-binding MarR family transcriptional regulator
MRRNERQYKVMQWLDEHGGRGCAVEISGDLGLSYADVAMGLLRCYRHRWLNRKRLASDIGAPRQYEYSLNDKGRRRLAWLEENYGFGELVRGRVLE